MKFCDKCKHRKVCKYKNDVEVYTEQLLKDIPALPTILTFHLYCQEFERENQND